MSTGTGFIPVPYVVIFTQVISKPLIEISSTVAIREIYTCIHLYRRASSCAVIQINTVVSISENAAVKIDTTVCNFPLQFLFKKINK
jgi:hypothetical protein